MQAKNDKSPLLDAHIMPFDMDSLMTEHIFPFFRCQICRNINAGRHPHHKRCGQSFHLIYIRFQIFPVFQLLPQFPRRNHAVSQQNHSPSKPYHRSPFHNPFHGKNFFSQFPHWCPFRHKIIHNRNAAFRLRHCLIQLLLPKTFYPHRHRAV